MKKPLAVDEKVRVYFYSTRTNNSSYKDIYIESVQGDIICFKEDEYTFVKVHKRQCVRLVKKKKEKIRVWAHLNSLRNLTGGKSRAIGIKSSPYNDGHHEIECELKVIGKKK